MVSLSHPPSHCPSIPLSPGLPVLAGEQRSPGSHQPAEFAPPAPQSSAQREDALGQLARVFQKIAREVRIREEKLKQQVKELRIVLDEARQQKKVAEITETQYFKNLQSEAESLRNIIAGASDEQGSTT